MPVTAMASGPAETDLDQAVAQAIAIQSSLQPGTQRIDLVLSAREEDLPPQTNGEADKEALPQEAPLPENAVRVYHNGKTVNMKNYARLVDGVIYVTVKDFFEAMGCTVAWKDGGLSITRGEELSGRLQMRSRLAEFNDRCWYMDQACGWVDDMPMLPLSEAAKVFNCTLRWDSPSQTAFLEGYGLLGSGGSYYDADDLLWIARIVRHEAGNQPLEGKVAVANVILNRMASKNFPDTAEEVIFDTRTGVQFVTRESTKIYIEPSEECFLAAKLALEGYETAPGCLYFASNRVAKRCWAGRNRPWFGSIGDHTFFL